MQAVSNILKPRLCFSKNRSIRIQLRKQETIVWSILCTECDLKQQGIIMINRSSDANSQYLQFILKNAPSMFESKTDGVRYNMVELLPFLATHCAHILSDSSILKAWASICLDASQEITNCFSKSIHIILDAIMVRALFI